MKLPLYVLALGAALGLSNSAHAQNGAQPAAVGKPTATLPVTPAPHSDLVALEAKLREVILPVQPDARFELNGGNLIVSYRSDKYSTHITDWRGNVSKEAAEKFPADFSEFLLYLSVGHDRMHYRYPQPKSELPRPETFGDTLFTRFNLKPIDHSGVGDADASGAFEDVPLGHWVYPALQRLVPTAFPNMAGQRPMTRYEFAAAMAHFLLKTEGDKAQPPLSPALTEIRDALEAEFLPDILALAEGDETLFNLTHKKPIIYNQTWQPRYEYLSLTFSYGKAVDKGLVAKIQQLLADYAAEKLKDSLPPVQ